METILFSIFNNYPNVRTEWTISKVADDGKQGGLADGSAGI